jgi:hypothetical protein
MKLDLQDVHEDCGGICILSEMGQRSVHPESASDIDECRVTMWDHLNEIFDEIVEKYREVWIVAKKQCLRNTAAHDNLVLCKLSIVAVASSHTIVARVLYVIKRLIMETSLGVEFLTVRVRAPNTNEWEKVSHLIEYSRGTPVPGGDYDGRLMCYVNEPFVMQPNMLSYTGGELTMGKGSPVVAWGKPKLNMKSLIESELVGVKDMMPIMFWIRNFLLEQGERIVVDLLLDNKSPSPWEQNGKTPSWEKDNVCQHEVDRNHYG